MGEYLDREDVQRSIATCGLICRLCFRAAECDGCRSAGNLCERDRSDAGCFQRSCCRDKKIAGCWRCPDLKTCTQGIYDLGDESKVKAFALCIQEDGLEMFVDYVMKNRAQGLSVEKGRDYDGKPIAAVLDLLRNGTR